MTDIPIVMTAAGALPVLPTDLHNQLIALVSATNPGYTANLPGSLIEDVSSTDVFALATCDQARVETINSLTPTGANDFLLTQLGQMYGVLPGTATNAAVQVRFTGTVGYVVPQGFTVSDGTNQYIVQDGGIVQTDGTTALLSAVSPTTGAWAIPANSVTTLITPVPTGIALACTNPSAGVVGGAAETAENYRARVLQAGLAAGQGMARYLKTLLLNVPGVVPRLVAVQQQIGGGGWKVICGGGDNYAVAYAIFQALFDVTLVVPSATHVIGITTDKNCVVTTDLNHGYIDGQRVMIFGTTPNTFDGFYYITVKNKNQFYINRDTTNWGGYVGGGECSPNNRSALVTVYDAPDKYVVPIVVPPMQSVAMIVTWNTLSPNFVLSSTVSQLGALALIDYVNSIQVGTPLNLIDMTAIFQQAVAGVLPAALLTRLTFLVSIDGVPSAPDSGEGYISGDSESYFYAGPSSILVVQG